MTLREAVIIVIAAAAVSAPLHVLHVRQDRKDEARAFGRGLIAGQCFIIRDRWQGEPVQPDDVTQSLADCEPYLNEMERRIGGRL